MMPCPPCRPRPRRLVVAASLLFLALAHAAFAQPAPKLTAVSPEWIQRGTTIEVSLTGENLGGVTQVLFNGDPGLTATNIPSTPPAARPVITVESTGGGISRAEPTAAPREEKRLLLRITAAADAPFGPRELRVVAPGGVSNPLNLNVGQWPEVNEKEIQTATPAGQAVALPVSISGVINAAAQADAYRFKAAKGAELVFEVEAARRGSPLDASLAVLDAQGKELARNEDALGLDSLLFFTAPEEGEYVVTLRDFRYQGGGNYTYRLHAGALPYVESMFPFGAQRGKPVEIALTGHNLEGTTKMTLNIDAKAPRGRQDIRAHTPRGYSNLVPFEVSDLPEIPEAEPNDAGTNAQTVALPQIINGRIGTARDRDRFRIKSDKDQKLVCEVAASRFGSRLDAHLALLDTNGAVLFQNDDTAGADARLEFDAKKDAEYVLVLRDLTDRGGEQFGYRLSIRPPSAGAGAGFTARFAPDTLRVHRDGLARVRCEVTRSGGFDGPLRLEFADLPSGVYAEPLLMPNGPHSGLLVVAATKDAPLGSFPVRLTVTGTINGSPVTVAASPLAGANPVRQAYLTVLDAAPFSLAIASLHAGAEQGQATTLEVLAQRAPGFTGDIKLTTEGYSAAPADPLSKSFNGGEATLKAAATTAKITLTPKMDSEVGTRTVVVRGEAAGVVQFTQPVPVTVTQYPLVIASLLSRLNVTALPPGSTSAAGETETKITVQRRAGFNGEVELALEGLPAGIQSELPKIPAGVGEVVLKLKASDKAPPGTNTLTVRGIAVFNDRTFKAKSGDITLVISAPEQVEVASTNAPPAAAAPAAAPAAATAK